MNLCFGVTFVVTVGVIASGRLSTVLVELVLGFNFCTYERGHTFYFGWKNNVI